MGVGRVLIELRMAAPTERVWAALTVPEQVTAWDGVEALDVPEGYPSPGQHARWRTRLGLLPLVLHDRIQAVEPGRRLASIIEVGFVRLEEEYRLRTDAGGTVLVSDNQARARLPGLERVAERLARQSIEASMARLQRFCDAGGAVGVDQA